MTTNFAEYPARKINGFAILALIIVLILLDVSLLFNSLTTNHTLPDFLWRFIPITLALLFSLMGLTIIQPNDARVLVFFGRYAGTVRDAGFWWVNPFTSRERISLRIRNFNSPQLKVNDNHGNPIEIAAVVVWQVIDTAHALFDVEDYEQFVSIQSETAIRTLASHYPYDAQHEQRTSLRGSPDEVTHTLQTELQNRLAAAGVKIVESRISHLAYAPEIAHAMLRRQQAQAIIAARQIIVDGAVGMVKSALHALSEQNVVELDEERKAAMVNNLLVALVAEREAQPVLNTGSLF